MPTKLKGMTSLEIAIIVAIVLIIAVAVGWYIYTTFIAAAGGQPRLNIVSAELIGVTGDDSPQLKLRVVNPGPVDVKIENVEVAGQFVQDLQCTRISGGGDVKDNVIKVGDQAECTGTVDIRATPGTMLTGRVIVSGGQSFLFNAAVRP